MTSIRVSRVQDLIREVVSGLLLYKAKDPRLKSVNVTEVKMTPDLKRAVVYYSIFDDRLDKEDIQRGLDHAKGFMRREVGREIDLKFVPELVFEYDKLQEKARYIDKLLKQIAPSGGDVEDNGSV